MIGAVYPALRIAYLKVDHFFNELTVAIKAKDTEPLRKKYQANEVLLLDDVQTLVTMERTQEEIFYVLEYLLQPFIEIIVAPILRLLLLIGISADILEQLAWRDEIAFLLHQCRPLLIGFYIRNPCIIKLIIPQFRHRASAVLSVSLPLSPIDISGQILGDITIKQDSQHILLKIPAVHAPAHVIGNLPDCPMQLCSFYFFLIIQRKILPTLNHNPIYRISEASFHSFSPPSHF